MRPPRPPPARPTADSLHEVALDYLARYAATAETLRRVLLRRVARWAREMAQDREGHEAAEAAMPALEAAVEAEVTRMTGCGAVDDAEFAAMRARSLARSGRSGRFIAAHLAARGVAGETVRAVLPEGAEAELAAALALARRRRIGPFRRPDRPDDPERARGVLARAGFARDVVEQALACEPERAEEIVEALRREGSPSFS